MKNTFFTILLVTMVILLMPQKTKASDSYATIDWRGAYVIGSGFETYKHPVIQTCIGHAFDNDFEFSFWNSLPASFDDISGNAGTEVDLNLQYHLGPLTVGAAYFFMFPDKNEFYENDVLQLNAEISKTFLFGNAIATPGFRIEYDFPTDGHFDNQNTGLYLIPKIDLAYSLNDKWKVGINTQFEVDLGGYCADKALVIDIAPKVTYQITKDISLNVGIDNYLTVVKSNEDPRQCLHIPRMGISFLF